MDCVTYINQNAEHIDLPSSRFQNKFLQGMMEKKRPEENFLTFGTQIKKDVVIFWYLWDDLQNISRQRQLESKIWLIVIEYFHRSRCGSFSSLSSNLVSRNNWFFHFPLYAIIYRNAFSYNSDLYIWMLWHYLLIFYNDLLNKYKKCILCRSCDWYYVYSI